MSILGLDLSSLWTHASSEQLANVIGHAIAPTFLLGAISGFVSVLANRLARIIDRIRSINSIADHEEGRLHLKEDIPRLRKRARMIHRSIFLAVSSGIVTTLIVIFSFEGALLGFQHQFGSAILFVLAQTLFALALLDFAREMRISLSDYDDYA